MQLVDTCAIVTGGASGIGAATVAALQAAGARVAVLDLHGAPGADLSLTVDVGDEEQVIGGVRDAVGHLGALDIAVVNAGIGGMGAILDLSTEEWDRVMRVNLRGGFVTLRECARAMVAGERPGAIVAVTSVSGFLTDRSMAHYSVSKAGLAALVRVAARELGPRGIRVNGVAPGTTDTPMFAATDAMRGYRERVAGQAALGRVGTAAEVAQAIVALCTLDWVTGQIVAADGGVSLASPIDPTDSMPDPGARDTGVSVTVQIRAVIFDFDGLVLDTELPIFVAWCAVFEAHDAVPPTIEEWSAGIGTTEGVDVQAWLHERAGRPVDVDAANQARRLHRDALLEMERPMPGVEAWLDEADAAGYGIAIASSSPDDWVLDHLGRIGLRERFPTIVTAGGELRSKPAPDTYLAACARLEVEPGDALALEDSPNGIAAAKAAGLRCVTVPHPLTETLDLSAADLRLPSLAHCTLAEALARLS